MKTLTATIDETEPFEKLDVDHLVQNVLGQYVGFMNVDVQHTFEMLKRMLYIRERYPGYKNNVVLFQVACARYSYYIMGNCMLALRDILYQRDDISLADGA